MAYAVRKRIVPVAERPGLDARSRAAAKRALEIDPLEGRALGAVRMLDPTYRNWVEAERANREAVNKSPKFPILLFLLSDTLGSVGRWKEAREFSDRLDRKKFLLPGADRKVIVNLWAAGDLPAADAALETAVNQWPQHPQIFRTRLAYLMYSGRPQEVLDLLQRPRDLPIEIKEDYVEAVRAIAEALANRRPSTQAVSAVLEYLRDNPNSALQAAQACVALSDAATAYSIFNGYYFAEGEWSTLAPLGGDQDRVTSPLFQPAMRGIWQEAEFNRLLERIGLNSYWRESRTVPDFRRGN